jgi:hypothetical protein
MELDVHADNFATGKQRLWMAVLGSSFAAICLGLAFRLYRTYRGSPLGAAVGVLGLAIAVIWAIGSGWALYTASGRVLRYFFGAVSAALLVLAAWTALQA